MMHLCSRRSTAWTCSGLLVLSAVPGAVAQAADEVSVRDALERTAVLLQNGQARQALDALAPIESVEPDNPWMWFYRGSAYAQLRQPYRAMESYDHALDVLAEMSDPDPELAATLRSHRKQARRQVFGFSLKTGLAYDTNVTFLSGGASTLGLIAGQADSLFETGTRVDYAPIADEKETLAFGARLGHSWHFSVERFNFQDYGGYVRYARTLDDRWEAALQYDYDMTFLGNDPFLSNHAVSPSLTHHWPGGAGPFRLDRTTLYYLFEGRDFLFPTDAMLDQDGVVNAVGLQQSFKIRPLPAVPWVCDASLGYRLGSVATEGSEFDRLAHHWYAGLECPLLNPAKPEEYLIIPRRELRFRFGAHWQMDLYRNSSLFDYDRDHRSDLLTTLTFGLSQKLIEDDRWGDLILHGLIDCTNANSNVTQRDGVSPFTYNRVVYGLQIEWAW